MHIETNWHYAKFSIIHRICIFEENMTVINRSLHAEAEDVTVLQLVPIGHNMQ